MKEVIGKRIGVRWTPPALVYVYRQGQVLRMARIPVRDLPDRETADRIYDKHKDGLLRGLERRYVERMVEILRHHHGVDMADGRDEEMTASEAMSSAPGTEDVFIVTRSLEKDDGSCDGLSVGVPETDGFLPVARTGRKMDGRNKNTYLSPIVNRAGQDKTNVNDDTIPETLCLEETADITKKSLRKSGDRLNKEILDLISEDLNKVQTEKRCLAEIVRRNDGDIILGRHSRSFDESDEGLSKRIIPGTGSVKPSDLIENADARDGQRQDRRRRATREKRLLHGKTSLVGERDISPEEGRRHAYTGEMDPKGATDNPKAKDDVASKKDGKPPIGDDRSEDTDLDLDDDDIPLDPDEPDRPASVFSEDDDFWS